MSMNATRDRAETDPGRDLESARVRAEMLQGIYIHLILYPIVNGSLFLINWLTRGADGGWWAVWPLLAWSVGLAIHIAVVTLPVFSQDWVEHKASDLVDHQ